MDMLPSLFRVLRWPQRTAEILFSFVGSNLRRGHMYTVLSYKDFAFVLSRYLFSWLSRKIGFMLKSVLQEHIYKEIHKLSSYWFSKEAKSASVSSTERIHKAGDLVFTLIFDLIDWWSTVLSPNHQARLSSHLTHWLHQISHPLHTTTSADFITTFCNMQTFLLSLMCAHHYYLLHCVPCLSNTLPYCNPLHF